MNQLPEIGHLDAVYALAFSSDSSLLVSESADRTVKVWSVADRRVLKTVPLKDTWPPTIEPLDLRSLPGPEDTVLFASDVQSGDRKLWLHEEGVFTSRPYPGICDDPTIPASHEGRVSAIAFSPDGGTLASAGDDHVIKLWDTRSGALLAQLGRCRNPICEVSISRSTNLVAAARDRGAIQLWDWKGGCLLADRTISRGTVSSVALSPDGNTLVSGTKAGEITAWELPAWRARWTVCEPETSVNSVAVSYDHSWVASGGSCSDEGQVRLLRLETGQPGPPLEEYDRVDGLTCGSSWRVSAVAISPDGTTLAAAVAQEVRLWEIRTGEAIGVLPAKVRNRRDSVTSLAFSADGTTLAGGMDGMSIVLWDVAAKLERGRIRARRDSVASLGFSPDGRYLAVSTHYEHIVWVHEVDSGEVVAELLNRTNSVYGVAYSPDGWQLITGGADGLVKVWDIRTRRAVRTMCSPR